MEPAQRTNIVNNFLFAQKLPLKFGCFITAYANTVSVETVSLASTHLVRWRLDSCTSISVLLNSFNSFLMAAWISHRQTCLINSRVRLTVHVTHPPGRAVSTAVPGEPAWSVLHKDTPGARGRRSNLGCFAADALPWATRPYLHTCTGYLTFVVLKANLISSC